MADAFLSRLVDWANAQPDIAALILTGSRARPDGAVDSFSDYDLEIFTTDPERYTSDSGWMKEIGDVWVLLATESSRGCPTRLIIFEGGRKVDFSILPVSALGEAVDDNERNELYARGYRLLIDRNGLASRLPPPSYELAPRQVPNEDEFRATVDEFWFEAWHIPKYLDRNDLWVVKHRDWTMKGLLLQMLEWHAAAASGPALDIPHIGVRLKDWTRADTWDRLHETFGRFDAADSQRALLATISLFRDVAKETSSMLGYSYPDDVDKAISGYIAGLLDSPD
jgi:aminoglycoside 6-adenylyltransferase